MASGRFLQSTKPDKSIIPGSPGIGWKRRARRDDGVDTLAPREAFVLYARNAHRLDDGELSVRERALMQALRRIFGQAPVASRDCP